MFGQHVKCPSHKSFFNLLYPDRSWLACHGVRLAALANEVVRLFHLTTSLWSPPKVGKLETSNLWRMSIMSKCYMTCTDTSADRFCCL